MSNQSIWLGLGSNLGERKSHLEKAVLALKNTFGSLDCSPFYETEPQDYKKQGLFLNTVVHTKTTFSADKALNVIQEIERAGGRKRGDGPPKGPREIDIDILLYGESIINHRNNRGLTLIIPHPRLHQRLFMLLPLLDLNPHLIDPRDGESWHHKAQRLPEQGVKPYLL